MRHRPGPKVREHVRDIVRLAQRDAVMAQNRIRGDRVEIELRQRPVAQVLLARHVEHRAVGQLERDRPLGAFVERVRRQPGEQGARIGEAGLRIAQRAGRGVRLPSRAPHLQQRFGKRVAAQAIDGLLRLKGREADLRGKREHIGGEPLRQHIVGLGAQCPLVRGGLVEPRGQTLQHVRERRNEQRGRRHERSPEGVVRATIPANGDERRAQATGAERQRDAMAREGARCVPAKASGA
ncbi:hypothetical protein Y046_3873 [Burkholderia pseudomallei MSHR2990]|nr:hypothetical protein Y046_3873 [Burkholderia pseudomallei MSHR2990]